MSGPEQPFASSEAYLGWEMGWLRTRIDAYQGVREGTVVREAYLELVEAQRVERLTAALARRDAVAAGVAIPFHGLSARYGLEPLEEEVVLICLAPHLSFSLWNALVHAQGSVLKPYLEVGFVADLVAPPRHFVSSRQWCAPQARLVELGLIYTEAPPDASTSTSVLSHSLQAPHFLAAALLGRRPIDEQLVGFCELVEPVRELFNVIVPPSVMEKAEAFVRGFYRRSTLLSVDERAWTLLINGPRLSGKTCLAEGLARAFQRPLFVAHLDRLTRGPAGPGRLKLAARNARFLDAVLLLTRPETIDGRTPELLGTLTELLRSHRGVVIVEPHNADGLDDSFETLIQFAIELGRPDNDTRLLLWESLTPQDAQLDTSVDLAAVASTYELTGGQIEAAIAWARQKAQSRSEAIVLRQDDLEEGARSQLRSKLGDFTDPSSVKLTLEHLVLASEPMEQVREFLDACLQRQHVMNDWGFGRRLVTGRGLVALFSGEAGTGKTLCAEILANVLGLRLQMVSIPKVVSKWVGETEKNIREVFSHARAQNSMLLFDEADSLFATRVKVERAQDHYQNMEVNNLLQEIERFDGVVILTTNLEANMDSAFQRRILFKIDFPMPEKEQRRKIWETLLPPQAPIEGELDLEVLAEQFELTGGQIKNAIIRAAYQCSARHHGLTQAQLEIAAHQQAIAAGRLAPSLER